MITFNISASSLNLYLSNQLEFYYAYILKSEKDTETPDVYGLAGNIVHEVLENKAKKKYQNNDEAINDFKKLWNEKNIDEKLGLYNKKLNIEKYLEAIKNGLNLLDNTHNAIVAEEYVDFELVNNEKAKINVKGYIDLICKKENEIYIVDWKTSSSIDNGDNFKRQGLMYFYLYYLKHNILPTKIIFEYVKINRKKEFVFSLDEIKDFAKTLDIIVNDIIIKGEDVNNYEVGNLTSPFNSHSKKCNEQLEKRNGKKISSIIQNNRICFLDKLPELLEKVVDLKYSYFVDGYIFSELYKKRIWDGKQHLFKNNSIPFAFKNDFDELLEYYNKKTESKIFIEYIDERNRLVLDKTYNTEFIDSSKELRHYQKEAIESVKKNKIGILNLGTGAGKTLIASELVRRLNRATLFIVNRIELVRQTKKEFEENLGVEFGEISEGEMDIKQINIASIQSLVAILKRNNQESKELKKILYNMSFVIYDECQNLSNSKLYTFLNTYLVNMEYCIGLTGTPWRNDGATLQMNSFVGFPIYTKTTKELEDEGFLCTTKCIFIKNINVYDGIEDYSVQYKKCISENDDRNNKIVKIVNELKGKKILIITKLVKHAEDLNKLIPNSSIIVGKTESDVRKDLFNKFMNDDGVLIGSIKIFSAGINIPDLDIIINASAHKSSVDSIQIIGRLKRKHSSKSFGYYIDFDDSEIYFKESAKERKKILKNFGNEIIAENILLDDFLTNRKIYIVD